MELIQVRVDAETKAAAASLFEALGMDISTAVRSFLKKVFVELCMSFDIKLDDSTRRALAAVRSMRETSQANGNSEMTPEEVNDEIAKARKEREARKQ